MRALLLALTLGVTGTAALSGSTISFSGTGAAIPDNNTTGLTFTTNVASWGLIQHVRIDITNFTHSWVGDLQFTLEKVGGPGPVAYLNRLGLNTTTCPGSFGCDANLGLQGNSTRLGTYSWGVGGTNMLGLSNINTDNALIPFGLYLPASSLDAAFAGVNTQGAWRLVFKDLAGSDLSNSGWTYTVTFDAQIPEASTYALVGSALVLLGLWKYRRRVTPAPQASSGSTSLGTSS
jgi:hypothetical protein